MSSTTPTRVTSMIMFAALLRYDHRHNLRCYQKKTMGKIVQLAWSRFRFVGESERTMRGNGKLRSEKGNTEGSKCQRGSDTYFLLS